MVLASNFFPFRCSIEAFYCSAFSASLNLLSIYYLLLCFLWLGGTGTWTIEFAWNDIVSYWICLVWLAFFYLLSFIICSSSSASPVVRIGMLLPVVSACYFSQGSSQGSRNSEGVCLRWVNSIRLLWSFSIFFFYLQGPHFLSFFLEPFFFSTFDLDLIKVGIISLGK